MYYYKLEYRNLINKTTTGIPRGYLNDSAISSLLSQWNVHGSHPVGRYSEGKRPGTNLMGVVVISVGCDSGQCRVWQWSV